MTSTYHSVIPNLIGNRNALVGFVGCIKIPACAGKTTALSKSIILNLFQDLSRNLKTMDNQKFSIIDRIKSFKYAFNGLKLFFVTDYNGRIHLFAAIIAIGLSFYLNISNLEWIAILSVISAVFVAEILNAAIEKLADVVSPDYHPKIKIVKDLAAAAVLVAAFLAVVVGFIIFIPKLFL